MATKEYMDTWPGRAGGGGGGEVPSIYVHRSKTDKYMFIADEHSLYSLGNRRT
jgi:hypothetical protein